MRIDFYEMSGRFRDPLDVAGILVGKAWPASRSIAVIGDADQLEALNRHLWEQPKGRFLPHAIDDPLAPIVLTERPPDQTDLLINLKPDASIPDGRYSRVLEIVPPDESLRKHLRRRWTEWSARGAELHHHVLK
ncbi:MAG: DNA polymerase III subunit chi [Wenzhouxiangellaceae bacterium]